jgi:hypothetical protein
MKKKGILYLVWNGAQKLLGYIRNINNFEYSISVEITADSLVVKTGKELVAIIRDIKLEELLNPQKNNIY